MTKQTITTEIDIPDGYEFVRIGLPKCGELYVRQRHSIERATYDFDDAFTWSVVIVRPIWQPPSWMRPGWIVKWHINEFWCWCECEPRLINQDSIVTCRWDVSTGDIHNLTKSKMFDFTPPPCDDWRQSKRRIGGAE